jgi:hypothetical protein
MKPSTNSIKKFGRWLRGIFLAFVGLVGLFISVGSGFLMLVAAETSQKDLLIALLVLGLEFVASVYCLKKAVRQFRGHDEAAAKEPKNETLS